MRGVLAAGDAVDAIVLDALMPAEASSALALYAKHLRLPIVMISGSPEVIQFAIENVQTTAGKTVPNAGAS
jgi:hypothetical protein